nr:GNAT family N-acetyltransferase [uncultured Flavobacterium sp.]
MEIKQNNNEKNGFFEAYIDQGLAGRMSYTWAGSDKFIIDSTQVMEGFNGKGVGKELLAATVVYARENNFKIMPLCPFAKAGFDKNPDYNDVLLK